MIKEVKNAKSLELRYLSEALDDYRENAQAVGQLEAKGKQDSPEYEELIAALDDIEAQIVEEFGKLYRG